eukprot:GHVQ01015749.1.p1 GENE.GHVQ01015749.1~~GHVQ01015749.1.p1  ORF type:complete len:457 (+),score=24.38 GHVQ01015749.1:1533-2903(+)
MGNALNPLVFRPPRPPNYGHHKDLLYLTTEGGGIIPACFINRGYRCTLLFSHGNAEDLGSVVEYFRHQSVLWECNVFAYEYSGYGLSSGKPSEANTYADAEAAYKYVRHVLNISSDDIVLYGRSLGSGPSVELAIRHPVRGLVLQSPIASVHRVRFMAPFTLPGDMFLNIDKISKAPCPILFIHGLADEVVSIDNSKSMHRLCNKSRVFHCWIPGAGHNNLERDFGSTVDWHVKRFLHRLSIPCSSTNTCSSVEYYDVRFTKSVSMPQPSSTLALSMKHALTRSTRPARKTDQCHLTSKRKNSSLFHPTDNCHYAVRSHRTNEVSVSGPVATVCASTWLRIGTVRQDGQELTQPKGSKSNTVKEPGSTTHRTTASTWPHARLDSSQLLKKGHDPGEFPHLTVPSVKLSSVFLSYNTKECSPIQQCAASRHQGSGGGLSNVNMSVPPQIVRGSQLTA